MTSEQAEWLRTRQEQRAALAEARDAVNRVRLLDFRLPDRMRLSPRRYRLVMGALRALDALDWLRGEPSPPPQKPEATTR